MDFCLEVCVDSVESAVAAEAGGADRIELCSNLIIGGTTPSYELFQLVKQAVSIPVHVLIRPRFGDFLYTPAEKLEMKCQIENFIRLGVDGLVIGMLNPDGTLDMEGMKELFADVTDVPEGRQARTFALTLHRAFDMCRDPYQAYEQAAGFGFDYILTSGQKNSCREGLICLRKLAVQAEKMKILSGRLPSVPQIMAGGGIKGPEDIKLIYETGVRYFHMSGKTTLESEMVYRNPDVSMGLSVASEYSIWRTDADKITQITMLRR